MNIFKAQTNKMTFIGLILVSLCTTFSVSAVEVKTSTVSTNQAHSAQLKVTPKPCVALRKGQKCYLEVTFNWLHPQASDYCLVNTTTNNVIKCWQQQMKGQLSLDFQSKHSNTFALRRMQSTIDLAQTKIPVAWVYKSSKRAKSTWRIF